MKPIELLKQTFEDTASAYVKLFCRKHDLEFQGWVGGMVGSYADCGDYNFYFQDIMHDINTNQPKHTILAWYEIACKEAISYRTYTKVAERQTTEPTEPKDGDKVYIQEWSPFVKGSKTYGVLRQTEGTSGWHIVLDTGEHVAIDDLSKVYKA